MAGLRKDLSFVLVIFWLLVCTFGTSSPGYCLGDTIDADGEVLIEEEEDTMTISATGPLSAGLSHGAKVEAARTRFTSLDTNQDGKLDITELKDAHASIVTDEARRRLLLILDRDGNGYVTEEEMVAAATAEKTRDSNQWPSADVIAALTSASVIAAAGAFLCVRHRMAAAPRVPNADDVRSTRLERLARLSNSSAGTDPHRRNDDNDDPSSSGNTTSAGSAGGQRHAGMQVTPAGDSHVPGIVQTADGKSGKDSSASSGNGTGSGSSTTASSTATGSSGSSSSGTTLSSGVSSGGSGGNDDDDNNRRNLPRRTSGTTVLFQDTPQEEDDDGEGGVEVEGCDAGKRERMQIEGQGSQDDAAPCEAGEPAAKRPKGPPIDVRAKRLARFQAQASDSGATQAVPTTPTTPTEKSRENPLASSTGATMMASQGAVSKSSASPVTPRTVQPVAAAADGSQPSATRKTSQPAAKAAAVKLSPEDAAGQLLSSILDVNLTITGGGTYPCANSSCSLTFNAAAFPSAVDDSTKKVRGIFQRRLGRELDTARFCMACYARAERTEGSLAAMAPDSTGVSASDLLQKKLVEDILDISATSFLEQLIETGKTDKSGDLWSSFSRQSDSQSPFCQLLMRFSRFVSDGFIVSPTCLDRLMKMTAESQPAQETFMQLIRAAGDATMSVGRFDELALRFNMYNDALQVLLGSPVIQKVLTETLGKELTRCDKGSYFQSQSTLAGLLNISTLRFPFATNSPLHRCYGELKGFPQPHDDTVSTLNYQIQGAVQGGQSLVHSVLFKIIKQAQPRDTVLSWLSGVLCMNHLRTAAQFKGQQPDTLTASDGFMLNVCSVMLRLCQPIFTTIETDRLRKIDPSYTSRPWCRLDLHDEPCLARGRIDAKDRLKAGTERFAMPALYQGSANFLTECFHMTQLALYVGVMPTIRRFNSVLHDLARAQQSKTGKEREDLKTYSALFYLSWSTCLLDPVLVRQISEFYVTQAVWINMLLVNAAQEGGSEEEIHERQRNVCSNILEFSIKAMTSWFSFVVQHKPSLLTGLSMTALVDCCVLLLERPDLLPSPLAQTRIVELLLVFLETSNRASQHRPGHGWGSGVHTELASIVHTSPTVQTQLGPALLHTYAAVDLVEGLDVDKEDFDKFGARAHIQKLLKHMWSRNDCRSSVIAQVGTPRFERFLNATLDTLLYQMNDALRRVANVRQIQLAKDDEKAWKALSSKERREKEGFLRSEESVGSGFMKMAVKTLSLLEQMVEEPTVARLFWKAPLSVRASAAIVEFIDSLCGGHRMDLKVKDLEKMNFNPRQLVLTIVSLALRMAGLLESSGSSMASLMSSLSTPAAASLPAAGQISSGASLSSPDLDETSQSSTDSIASTGTAAAAAAAALSASSEDCNGFITALAEHPDYSDATMVQAGHILHQCPGASELHIKAFQSLMDKVKNLMTSLSADGLPLGDLTVESEDAADGGDGTAAVSTAAWQDLAEAVDLCIDGVADLYVEALRDSVVDTTEELADDHAMQSQFADQPLDPRSPKVHALMKEVMKLPTSLPLHPGSSIFLRQDEDRLDVIRAVITGPMDTPYSLGCFAFDIYCPASYPTNPPLVKLITTGSGTVRFNPNLYADGKVCLSLLGTWHGGDASEKWDPKTSSIYQVLLSIQGMILIPDPMYNEPGYERMRGTTEGNERSTKYNASLRLSTVRHAMLGMLRKPPIGFEDIIAVHFTIQKDVILRQLSRWLRECQSPGEEQKLRRAVDEFRAELEKV